MCNRFSSKEFMPASGLYYYLYRFYDPTLERWPNQDPVEDWGFITLVRRITLNGGANPYIFVANDAVNDIDAHGLDIWFCTVPTKAGPPLFGIGRHGYLWDDRSDTPPDQRECGEESACGSGHHSSHNGGPGPGWGQAKPGTICTRVDGSAGKEDQIMKDCNAHINNGLWIPVLDDCQSKARRCLKNNGLNPPPAHRF
jgi:RHS repeat-associated protein